MSTFDIRCEKEVQTPHEGLVADCFGSPSPLQTSVLFIVFNRPETTRKVFEEIRKAKPPRLYVAGDGPREERDGEEQKVRKVREIVDQVDWECDVKQLFREKNLGCKNAVSEAITWFFENEEQGIILEDDCLPDQSFFWFCEELLLRYSDNNKVFAITGDNFQKDNKRGAASYYFSKYNHVWGWASWRRAWQNFQIDMSFWPKWRDSSSWKSLHPDPAERRYWKKVFDKVYRNEIDTWDYQWTASVWYKRGLTATPNFNLISNIGFGTDATHAKSSSNCHACMPVTTLSPIFHPHDNLVIQDVIADKYLFEHHFSSLKIRSIRVLISPFGQILRKILSVFSKI